MPVWEPKAISELKGVKLYFLSMELSEKYIVTEKCQGWQNLGMSEKLKEKFRYVKCYSSKSKLKELQLIFFKCMIYIWWPAWHKKKKNLRIFLCECEINKGKSRLRKVKEGSTLEDEEQQVGILVRKYFHEISLPLRKVDGKFFYSSCLSVLVHEKCYQ